MILISSFLALAIVCTLLAGPWRAPQHLTAINHTALLALAGLLQLPLLWDSPPLVSPLTSAAIVVLWSIRNRHLPGSGWVLTGVLSNAAAMAAYGGAMPLDPGVAAQLGLSAATQMLPGSKDVIGNADLWQWLGDWLMIRIPQGTLVASLGDLCILIGLLRWACACRMHAWRAAPSLT